jgi:hypothetical protein
VRDDNGEWVVDGVCADSDECVDSGVCVGVECVALVALVAPKW